MPDDLGMAVILTVAILVAAVFLFFVIIEERDDE